MTPRVYKTRCIVLGKTKLGETDLILTLLAGNGEQLRAVAKGARKPGNRFGARVEPFSVLDAQFHVGKSLDILTDARSVAPNAALRTSLERTAAADVVAEFLNRVSRDASLEPRVFALAEASFTELTSCELALAPLVVAAFLVKAFAMLGVRPALSECAVCGSPVGEESDFDIHAGGVLCEACSPAGAPSGADAALVPWLRFILYSTYVEIAGAEEATDAPARKLLDFCESWALEHLSLKMRSFGFLKQLS